MAGKPKYGLDFYYKPTNEFSEIKIRKLTKRYKYLGYAIYNTLLTLIHQSGQFYKFESIDDLTFIVSENIYSEDSETLEVINYLVDNDIFDKDSFNKGYLTSLEIQIHHLHATKRRKVRLHTECLLIDEKDLKNLKVAYIDSMYVYIDEKFADKDNEVSLIDRHNNNHNQNNNQIIDKLMIKDASLDEASVPFKINYYLKILLDRNIVLISDPFIKDLNDFFNSIKNDYDSNDLTDAVRYVASFIKKSNWIDVKGNEIVNKKEYLESCIINSANKNSERRNNNFTTESMIKELEEDYLSGKYSY